MAISFESTSEHVERMIRGADFLPDRDVRDGCVVVTARTNRSGRAVAAFVMVDRKTSVESRILTPDELDLGMEPLDGRGRRDQRRVHVVPYGRQDGRADAFTTAIKSRLAEHDPEIGPDKDALAEAIRELIDEDGNLAVDTLSDFLARRLDSFGADDLLTEIREARGARGEP